MFREAVEQVVVKTMVDVVCAEGREVGEGRVGLDWLLGR